MLFGNLASSNTCIPSVCTHLPRWYVTLHPRLRWCHRENHKEIHEEKYKLGKVAANTVRKKRRWMLCLYNVFSKPRSDNVWLLTLQKRPFVLLLFTTVPCCCPSQCLWVTLGKSLKHSLLQFFLSTELPFPPCSLLSPFGYPSQAEECNLSTVLTWSRSLQVKAGLHPTCSEPWQVSAHLPEVSQADLSKVT